MADVDDGYGRLGPIVQYLKDTVLAPLRIATSPTLLRAYLRTLLLLLTSTLLFGTAVVAYTTFYYAYIPVRGIEVPVYLQYDHNLVPPPQSPRGPLDALVTRQPKHPFGIAGVEGLVSRQKYDVIVEMVVPRSERNLDAGNWMVGLEMRAPSTAGGDVKGMLGWEEEGWDADGFPQAGAAAESATGQSSTAPESRLWGARDTVVLVRSRRPAILTYRSWMTELAYRFLRLPLYVVGLRHESEPLAVRMMEDVQFDKGWRNVPSSLRLELRSRTPLEVYSVGVRFVAKLEGLRWVMYTYRLASLIVFTSAFWGVEMGVLLLTWALFSVCLGGGDAYDTADDYEKKRIKSESGVATPKTEPADSAPATPMSDTSRTFPTLPSQQSLHYSSPSDERAKWKDERETPRLEDIPPGSMEAEAEADDEDDDFLVEEPLPNAVGGVQTDSGIGTSLESSVERSGSLSRRRSGGKR